MRIKQHCQKNKSFIEALDSTWFQGLSFVQLGAQCFMEDLEFWSSTSKHGQKKKKIKRLINNDQIFWKQQEKLTIQFGIS